MDFTLGAYEILLNSLINQGFSFLTCESFTKAPSGKVILLRHDVDSLPDNSLQFARIQADRGIRGTYYFRIVPECYDEKIIKWIYDLGHEIGYHYEDLSATAQRRKGIRTEGLRDEKTKRLGDKNNRLQDRKSVRPQDRKSERSGDPASAGTARLQDNGHIEKELVDIAIESFAKNLQRLREIVPVKTICMHGSPLSKWDSRLLWKYYDYRDYGIVGEPYFDVNFDEVMYLTDTGRRWDGKSVSVRDKAAGKKDIETKRQSDDKGSLSPSVSSRVPFPEFHSTFDIIKAAEAGKLPDKIMMTFHPQRWTNKQFPWVKELVWQNVKNVAKFFLVKSR